MWEARPVKPVQPVLALEMLAGVVLLQVLNNLQLCPFVESKMLLTMVVTLNVGLSRIAHVLQYMAEQPRKQQWDCVSSL